jgi:4-diphosphocytidyl-2-C-methyl-D-erythritol kinase
MEVRRAGSTLRVDCPAKLNLFLEILAKRADGYHEIETLMVAISIVDTLFVTEDSEGRIRLSCCWASAMETRRHATAGDACGGLPPTSDNIVCKAVQRLRARAGTDGGAIFHLVKRIPSAAGLGGASSDAAAALVAVNELWRLGWPRARLAEVASEVGSDVPFFLSESQRGALGAICRGRGERIEPEFGIPPLHFVVVKPPIGLATPDVYRNCSVPIAPVKVHDMRDALRHGDPVDVGKSLFNRLQQTAEQLCPAVRELRSRFQQANVLGHQMSGSGTSYFGICRNRGQARQVAARLRGLGLGEVFHATTRPAW